MDSGFGANIPQILTITIIVVIVIIGLVMITNTPVGSLSSFMPSWIRQRMDSAKLDKEAFTFWSSTEMVPFNGLTVSENKAPVSVKSDVYTASIEMVWYNTRKWGDESSPYRHILHRGSGELKNQTLNVPLFATSQTSTICQPSTFGDLPEKGLPTEMNPGIFADPIINDLYVIITTAKNFKRNNEMIRIADVPMDKPFHLAIVMQKKLVEVYINCQLEVSKILEGEPVSVSKAWYGLSGKANLMAQIQNLQLWDRALSPYELKSRCPTIKFSTKRPSCPSMLEEGQKIVETVTKNEKATTDDLALTYGNSISQCK